MESIEGESGFPWQKEWACWCILVLMTLNYFWVCGLDVGAWIFGPERGSLLASGALSARYIDKGEIWRLPRSLFLHGDLLHLVLNALALWILGRLGESIYGPLRLVGILVLCGLSGALLSWSFGAHQTVGISGAIFGLLGAEIIVGWRNREHLPDDLGQALRIQLPFWAVVNILVGLLVPVIDNASHLGGLIAGLVLGVIVDDYWVKKARWKGGKDFLWGSLILVVGVVSLLKIAVRG